MEKVCFTSFVYGWYQDFIPLFVYSTLLSYPQHFVRVFLYEKLSDGNKRSLNLIRNQISNSFEVKDCFTELDDFNLPHKAAYRFVMGRQYFPEFEYIYISDIDFIVLNEHNNNFYDPYVEHCNQTGLPFSNYWNYDWGKYRVTGLHFIIKTPYFNVMDKWINIMKGQNSFRTQCRHNELNPSYDEEMLYYMLVHEFDLRPLIYYGRKYPGIHLADFREEPVVQKLQLNKKNFMNAAKDSTPLIYERFEKSLRKSDHIVKTDLFNEIHNNMSEKGKTCIGDYLQYIS